MPKKYPQWFSPFRKPYLQSPPLKHHIRNEVIDKIEIECFTDKSVVELITQLQSLVTAHGEGLTYYLETDLEVSLITLRVNKPVQVPNKSYKRELRNYEKAYKEYSLQLKEWDSLKQKWDQEAAIEEEKQARKLFEKLKKKFGDKVETLSK